MSSKHRHGLPKKRPDPNAKAEIEAELPTLEPVEAELPTLEPIADEPPPIPVEEGPVKTAVGASDEPSFDVVITIEVPAMDKKAVPDAVSGPLGRAAMAATDRVRHKRVLVRFTGEAVIGSAVKELVASTLKPHKPLKATVRRGFGDEAVFEGALPSVKVTTREQGGVLRVDVATGDLDSRDLPMALQPHLAALAVTASGRKFVLQFAGAAKADAAVRTMVADVLQSAGATRAAIGERVLFDRELAERVRVAAAADGATVDVMPSDDEMSTVDAISTVLPQHAAAFHGRVVRLRFAKPGRAAEIAACIDACRKAQASRVELAGAGEPEIVWPKLLQLVQGAETTLRVEPNGRSRAAVLVAFRRECAEHATAAKNAGVVIDWPVGFPFDAEVDAAVQTAIQTLAPKALACTFGGELREPFHPEAAAIVADGERHTLRIRGDAGKPVEVQRAVDRRMAVAGSSMRGKSVRVQVSGGVALSRTLLRSVCTAIEACGVARLEVEDGGKVDVLLPSMLTVSRAGAEVRIAADPNGRDDAQQTAALQRELDAAALSGGAIVTVAAGPIAEKVIAAVLTRSVARVVLDGPEPVQIHPPLFAKSERKAGSIRLPVVPGPDPAMVLRQLDRELHGALAGLGVLGTAAVTVAWPGATPTHEGFGRVLQGLLAKRVARVWLDSGIGAAIQVHPANASSFAPPPASAPAVAPPAPVLGGAAGAALPPAAVLPPPPSAAPVPVVGAQMPSVSADGLITVLGRRDDTTPPFVILGVAAGQDPAHVATVEAALQAHLPRLRGRSVLLVLRHGEQDVPLRRDNELAAMLRRVVGPVAAATMWFRGPDAQQRPHFEVTNSTLRSLRVGSTFGDPRVRSVTSPVSTGGAS